MSGIKKYIFFVMIFSTSAFADVAPIIITENLKVVYINDHATWFKDTSHKLTFHDIKKFEDEFSTYDDRIFKVIYSSPSNWYQFTISNTSKEVLHLLLECQYPQLDFVDVYYDNGSAFHEFHTGDHFPFDHRPIRHHTFVFPIDAPPGLTTCFVRIKSVSPIAFPMYLYSLDYFDQKKNSENFSVGILSGFVLFFIIFYIIIFLYTRKRIFFASILIIMSMGFGSLHETGFLYKLMFPDDPFINSISPLINIMVGLFFLFMAVDCFETPPQRGKLFKLYIKIVQYGVLVLLITVCFIEFRYARQVVYIYFMINITVAYLFIIALYGREKEYRLVIIGYTFLLVYIYLDSMLHQLIAHNYFLSEFNHLVRPLFGVSGMIIWGVGLMVIGSQGLRRREFAEEQLIRKIKKSEDVQTEFINDLTHELATPLQTIMYSTEKIIRLKKGESLSTYIDRIFSATDRISTLINNFLDHARSDKYDLNLDLQEEDLKEIIDNIIFELDMIISKAKHEIIFEVDDVAENNYHLSVDRIYIEQAIFNIMTNSIKYTPEGGKILIRLKKARGIITISIADNGYGISEVSSTAIFEPFYRVDFLNSASSGVGLGLSISKKWVEAHGGWIECQSPLPKNFSKAIPLDNIRKGSLFRIHLPVNQK